MFVFNHIFKQAQVTNLMANQHKSDTVIVDLNSEIKLYKEQLQKAHMKLTAEKVTYFQLYILYIHSLYIILIQDTYFLYLVTASHKYRTH